MSIRGENGFTPPGNSLPGCSSSSSSSILQNPFPNGDPRLPLQNLSTVQSRMDSLQRFLSHSVNGNTLLTTHQMSMVSSEITSAIHQIIVNGAALLSYSQNLVPPPSHPSPLPPAAPDNQIVSDDDIVELDAVELLAEHVHFCKICGKGFKRDANLRMHMRAHGNQYKTPEALAKPINDNNGNVDNNLARKTRFSCPYVGCNRNKNNKRFRPLKSLICVRNHFRRSHCPKMYSCTKCQKKSFSVVSDLKNHLKHCGGEARWKCSCGTNFSRKDKLFGHIGLFEGHMPAVLGGGGDVEEDNGLVVIEEEEKEKDGEMENGEGMSFLDDGFVEGLLDGFDSIEGYLLQDGL